MTETTKRILLPSSIAAGLSGLVLMSATIGHIVPHFGSKTSAPVAARPDQASRVVAPAVTKPRKHRPILSGLASWYGGVFEGRRTANGEVFSKYAMTACHRTLPFGTLVRVINLRNKQSVIVRINDRGELRPDRVIDLSSAAAEKIGIMEAGLAPVKLEIVKTAQG